MNETWQLVETACSFLLIRFTTSLQSRPAAAAAVLPECNYNIQFAVALSAVSIVRPGVFDVSN